jgi:hypothetical protein
MKSTLDDTYSGMESKDPDYCVSTRLKKGINSKRNQD